MDDQVKDDNTATWVPEALGQVQQSKANPALGQELQKRPRPIWDSERVQKRRALKAAEAAKALLLQATNSQSSDKSRPPIRKVVIKSRSYIEPKMILEKFSAGSDSFKIQSTEFYSNTFEFFHFLQRVFGIAQQASEFIIPPDSTPPRIKSLMATLPRIHLPSEGKSLKQFTVFPHLPLELKNYIWRLASYQLGVTEIGHNANGNYPTISSTPYPPAILCTNKEARKEGLRHFQKCSVKTASWHGGLKQNNKYWRKDHYINFNHTRFVGRSLVQFPFHLDGFSALEVDDLAKIQDITIVHTGYQPRGIHQNITDFIGPLPYLRNLQRVIIVISNWCAAAGVQQGASQELFRKEVHDNFMKTMNQLLKDGRSKAEVRIFFKDWNDTDTAPCSADPEKGCGKKYFDLVERPDVTD